MNVADLFFVYYDNTESQERNTQVIIYGLENIKAYLRFLKQLPQMSNIQVFNALIMPNGLITTGDEINIKE